jgi:hypothetical protein
MEIVASKHCKLMRFYCIQLQSMNKWINDNTCARWSSSYKSQSKHFHIWAPVSLWLLMEKYKGWYWTRKTGAGTEQLVVWLGYSKDHQEIVIQFLAGGTDFSLVWRVQIGSGTHTAFYPMSTWVSFNAGKGQRGKPDNSPPCSAKVKHF